MDIDDEERVFLGRKPAGLPDRREVVDGGRMNAGRVGTPYLDEPTAG